jgi:hypothetical protein
MRHVTQKTINLWMNKKVGRLTIIEIFPIKINNVSILHVKCNCECGNNKIIRFANIKNNSTKSCGCLRVEISTARFEKFNPEKVKLGLAREPRLASAKAIYNKCYADGYLPFEDFLKLSQMNCYYCGVKPSNLSNVYSSIKTRKFSKERVDNADFIYNGLDRIDNKKLHTLDNVVTCCKFCNYAKNIRSQSDFFDWVNQIYNLHLRKKE